MSIGSLGVVGSLTTGQLQQTRGAETDRAAQVARDHGREVDSAKRTADAAGIGLTNEDEGASDRDADGRRLWEHTPPVTEPPTAEADQLDAQQPRGADPSGNAGSNLDLTG